MARRQVKTLVLALFLLVAVEAFADEPVGEEGPPSAEREIATYAWRTMTADGAQPAPSLFCICAGKEIVARGTGSQWTGRPVGGGRPVAWVLVPGYEIQRCVLVRNSTVDVALRPTDQFAEIIPPKDASVANAVLFSVRYRHWVGEGADRLKVFDRSVPDAPVGNRPRHVPLGKGLVVRAFFRRVDRGMVWPVFAPLRDKQVVQVKGREPRIASIEVQTPWPELFDGSMSVEVFLDGASVPGWTPEKIDGFRWWSIAHAPYGRSGPRDGVVEVSAMDADYHCFLYSVGSGAAYCHVMSGDEDVKIKWPIQREFESVMWAEHERSPTGCVVAPGRLDIVAFGQLAKSRLADYLVRDVSRGRFTLPLTDTYTAFHIDHGIAYLQVDGRRLAGSFEPRSIRLNAPAGWTFTGRVMLQLRWKRQSSVRTGGGGSSVAIRTVANGTSVKIPGIPAGMYSVHLKGNLNGPRGARSSVDAHMAFDLRTGRA